MTKWEIPFFRGPIVQLYFYFYRPLAFFQFHTESFNGTVKSGDVRPGASYLNRWLVAITHGLKKRQLLLSTSRIN